MLTRTAIIISAALLVASCGNDSAGTRIASSSGEQDTCSSRGEYNWGGPIELVNQDGETVTEDAFKGRHTIMFFGFTECPDACPIIMEKIIYALDELPEGTEKPRAMMISFDPERDTPEKLKQYISNEYFPEDMVGLTGSQEAIEAAAEEFQARYFRQELKDSAMEYTFDHTTAIYLMNADWEMETFFLPTENPNDMAACMQKFLPKA
tara:strand:+ start:23332 stop:23955 length:624 start_codon:yes stop_codon:yes gene_type:complete